ncbi:MAG: hypothetical protein JOZ90_08850 [Alphaproteobacteria bacterium]|nr:hypothetical protein [Alphaproteobacteria bacterium]MBV9371164.1 hypothetical protein [Alphaproteobacteria bacterium]MBV9901191.1 hypothetical protein [Alphaproteobacteria bacterium]
MKKTAALLFAAAIGLSMSVPASAASDGKNRKVTVLNLSTSTLRELYASPITSTNWEEDLLGQRTLTSGQSISANIDNGTTECYYDLKAVLANGKTWEHRKVNVCAASKWVIADAGESIQ